MMIVTVVHRPHVFTVAVLVATAICAATARAEVVSLDGIWQAEVAQDAQGDAMPAAFTRTIPVPGHWPLMKPSVPCGKKETLWCRTTWKAPTAIPPPRDGTRSGGCEGHDQGTGGAFRRHVQRAAVADAR